MISRLALNAKSAPDKCFTRVRLGCCTKARALLRQPLGQVVFAIARAVFVETLSAQNQIPT